MCMPHPAYEGRPQLLQVIRRHMIDSNFMHRATTKWSLTRTFGPRVKRPETCDASRALALVSFVLVACGQRAPADAITPAERTRAAGMIGELKRSLLTAVTQAMQAGAPAAIDACHEMAPAITARAATNGATIGRATRRPRNPANVARDWQLDAIAHFEQVGHGAGVRPFERVLPSGRVAYAEPLVIGEVCLTCHGTPAPEVATILRERYPADQATGYALGELRGIAWVELPR